MLSISLFFIKYFKKSDKTIKPIIELQNSNLNKNTSSNFIKNIDYISSDANGNKYQITAEFAEIDKNLTDIMFLKNVFAYIYSKNSDVIKITSEFGKYNTINYDTIFSIDVKIYYNNQFATGEYLDFSLINNLATMSDNVMYFHGKTELKADMVEIDINTKESKIFMNEISKKVIVIGEK